jgi:hypothetical protein
MIETVIIVSGIACSFLMTHVVCIKLIDSIGETNESQ